MVSMDYAEVGYRHAGAAAFAGIAAAGLARWGVWADRCSLERGKRALYPLLSGPIEKKICNFLVAQGAHVGTPGFDLAARGTPDDI